MPFKNCPNCEAKGTTKNLTVMQNKEQFFIMCDMCMYRTKEFDTEEEAILHWNTIPRGLNRFR